MTPHRPVDGSNRNAPGAGSACRRPDDMPSGLALSRSRTCGGDGRPQPGAERQVLRGRVHPVKMVGRLNLVVRQRAMHIGQGRPDEVLFSGVLAREFMARNPGQQRQPVITGADNKLAVGSGDGCSSRNAGLLKPLRDGHAPGELDTVTRRYRLGDPSPVAAINEPGLRAHAAVVDRYPDALQAPVTPQGGEQRGLGDSPAESTRAGRPSATGFPRPTRAGGVRSGAGRSRRPSAVTYTQVWVGPPRLRRPSMRAPRPEPGGRVGCPVR